MYIIVYTDECVLGTHTCDQVCTNIEGPYTCSCNEGYTLDSDGQTCNPIPTTQAPNGCGGRLTTASGSFQTPQWPNRYPQDDFQCEWIIDLPNNGNTIEFTIGSPFGTNGRPPCNQYSDPLEFFDGTASNAASFAKICGLRSMYGSGNNFPATITSSTSEARVVFTGSHNPNRPGSRVGIRVTYRAV